jgi:hypothetical protein
LLVVDCCAALAHQVSKEANAALLNLQPYADQPVKVEVGPVLAIISRELRSEQEPTRLEALRWCVSRAAVGKAAWLLWL